MAIAFFLATHNNLEKLNILLVFDVFWPELQGLFAQNGAKRVPTNREH
jgi:hypothetical protein